MLYQNQLAAIKGIIAETETTIAKHGLAFENVSYKLLYEHALADIKTVLDLKIE